MVDALDGHQTSHPGNAHRSAELDGTHATACQLEQQFVLTETAHGFTAYNGFRHLSAVTMWQSCPPSAGRHFLSMVRDRPRNGSARPHGPRSIENTGQMGDVDLSNR